MLPMVMHTFQSAWGGGPMEVAELEDGVAREYRSFIKTIAR